MKPSAATSACAVTDARLLAVDADLDLLEVGVAAQLGDLGVGDDLDGRLLDRRDRPLVGAERVAPVHEGHRRGDRLEVLRPVEGAVAPADDDDVLAGVRREAGHEELHAATHPALAGRQRPRAELADPRGDQHGTRGDPRALVEGDHDVVLTVLERGGGPVEEVRRAGCGRLLDEPLDEVTTLDAGEAGDVEDRLLGVHRGDLAAQLGQGVDDRDAHPPEAGVVGGVETGRAGSDDQQVRRHVGPRRDPSVRGVRPQGWCRWGQWLRAHRARRPASRRRRGAASRGRGRGRGWARRGRRRTCSG